MKREDWVVHEAWEGDGKPGACFSLPGTAVTVFVTAWDEAAGVMTKEEFELAVKIRDFLRAGAP